MAFRICEPPPPPTSPCTRTELYRDGRTVPSPCTTTKRINSPRHLIRSRGDQGQWQAVASLSDIEVKAMAGADPTHLRALIMPDYSRVATSFSELLLRVVRRCKRDSQVCANATTNHFIALCQVCTVFQASRKGCCYDAAHTYTAPYGRSCAAFLKKIRVYRDTKI